MFALASKEEPCPARLASLNYEPKPNALDVQYEICSKFMKLAS